jgi:GNAT superfamily N-acetyltransferase
VGHIVLRSLHSDEAATAVALMSRLGVTFAGSSSAPVLRALSRSRQVIRIVAADQSGLIGIALAQRHRLWVLQHPTVIGPIAVLRALERARESLRGTSDAAPVPASREVLPEYVEVGPPPVSWTANIPSVVFIGVLPGRRGQGTAAQLYHALFDSVRNTGATLLKARIAEDNVASLRLHHSTGWRLYSDGGVVTALKPL